MDKTILIKPVITEKAEGKTEGLGQYSFIVARRANKVEIKKAVEAMFSVNVDSVNTLTMPGKAKSRSTKSGYVKGKASAYKKAIVKLVRGEEIDFFGEL